MKMHILSGGRLQMRRSVYYPGAPREEMFSLPVSCVLLKHEQGNVLFDTGCSPQAATDPEGRWGPLARAMMPTFEPQDAVIGQLPLAGLEANDIDVVICSHLHPDHCGCNAYFTRATVICHARELELARSADGPALGYLPADWDHPNRFDTIEADRDVFGDGRLTLVPMPGHTPGMTVAHVALDRDGAFLLASDAAPVRAVIDEGYAPRNSWDKDKATAAVAEITRFEKDGATILLGHDDAQWRTLRTGAAWYE